MSGPYLLSILLSIPLLVLTIAFVLGKKKTKKIASELQTVQKNSQNIQTLIKNAENSPQPGRTLENVIDSLVSNLQNSYPYSSLSSVVIKGGKIVFKTTVKESVNRAFVQHIRDSMAQSLYKPENVQYEIEESIIGAPVDDLSTSSIMSSFDIKFTAKDKLVAVINLSSTTPNLYSASDAQTLNSVSEIVSVFLAKTESLLDIEKSKTLSMIDSFSEGIFMVDDKLELTAINNAALNFLNIHKDIPNISDVFSSLPNTYDFKDKINTCIGLNKQITEEDVPIIDKIFRVILTPVLEIDSFNKNMPAQQSDIIGVSFLLQDTTLEKSLSHLKEDFTNIMVHELRSPITAIKASSEFLQSRADFTDAEKKQLMWMISESSKKMLDKIALILDSAKMEAGLFSIKKTPSDLKKLITDRVSVFMPLATEKSINLKVNIDESLPNFPFDPIRIDEVINNLLSNSLKFTPNGGKIQLDIHQAGEIVNVRVTDTGSGIAKDKQHLLFSKFQQAPTSGQNQGTGLGLYVVKGVVEAHGGTVNLDSIEGHGTTISFTLPISESTPAFVLPSAPKVINPLSN